MQHTLPAHYFTADTHLGYERILTLDDRPWLDIDEHDEALTANMTPTIEDTNRSPELWILGDVGYQKRHVVKLLERLRTKWAKIHLIRGNHDDKAAWKVRHLFDSANEALYVRFTPEVRVYLSHYAHRVWRNSHHGSYHLHGHSHGALPWLGRSMDVGTLVNAYHPISLAQVVKCLEPAGTTNHH